MLRRLLIDGGLNSVQFGMYLVYVRLLKLCAVFVNFLEVGPGLVNANFKVDEANTLVVVVVDCSVPEKLFYATAVIEDKLVNCSDQNLPHQVERQYSQTDPNINRNMQ
jgi:hypothetical protein